MPFSNFKQHAYHLVANAWYVCRCWRKYWGASVHTYEWGGWEFCLRTPIFALIMGDGFADWMTETVEFGVRAWFLPTRWHGVLAQGSCMYRHEYRNTKRASMELIALIGYRRVRQLIRQYGEGPIPAQEFK